jgi:adhesin transport system membrane fusion protein
LVEVVPLDDALILEAKVAPKDIAFLRPGQPAMVKFTAYDFSTYGGLEAKLEHIGADSITDERGNTFFLVRVRTAKSSLGANLPIIPGMVAEVDIVTGKKSILEYLLKPVLRAKQAALTER